jgi:hypothetical protein
MDINNQIMPMDYNSIIILRYNDINTFLRIFSMYCLTGMKEVVWILHTGNLETEKGQRMN